MSRDYELFVRFLLLLQLITGILAQLPMRLNADLADEGKFVYTLNAQFEEDILTTWSDGDITMLAQQAYAQMVSRAFTDRTTYLKFKKTSPVVSAIVTGHSVYFSSSLTGGGSLQYIPNNDCGYKKQWIPGNGTPETSCPLVYEALKACQLRSSSNSGHRTGGNCGEVMAAMTFCTVNPNGNLVNAKVVTWGLSGKVQSVWDPCIQTTEDLASIDVWGCDSFVKTLQMLVIGGKTSPSNRAIPNFTPTWSPLT